MDKIKALSHAKGNFDQKMSLSPTSIHELQWWLQNIVNQKKTASGCCPDKVLTTDASNEGWGAALQGTTLTAGGGGLFKDYEMTMHINAKELAVFLGVKSFCNNDHDIHVRVLVDNTTAVAYIREMGGGGTHSVICSRLVHDTWLWARDRNIRISVAHIPGVENVSADPLSRNFHKGTEWKLHSRIFTHVLDHFQCPVDIDLMASRTNHQVERFLSWRPDPEAFAIDAFTLDWRDFRFWYFPHFQSIITSAAENTARPGYRPASVPILADSTLVSSGNAVADRPAAGPAKKTTSPSPARATRRFTRAPPTGTPAVDGLPLVGRFLADQGISGQTAAVITLAWRQSTIMAVSAVLAEVGGILW